MVVYLDHAATTPMVPEVRALMVELLGVDGNPAAAHACGRAAKAVLERARAEAACALGVSPREVVFTGSATEALDIGIGDLALDPDVVVATSPIEHPAVLDALAGRHSVVLPLDGEGRVAVGAAREILRGLGPRLGALVVTGAASETGVIQPVARLADIARSVAPKAIVVSDLVALAPLGLDEGSPARRVLDAVDVAVIAPHKLGGPTGVGVLVVRERTPLAPRRRHAGQERGLRGGTQAVWLAGGAARSLSLAGAHGVARREAIIARRDRLERSLAEVLGAHRVAGTGAARVGISLVVVPGARSEELAVLLDAEGVCVSVGAACQAGAPEPSPSLLAMGWDEDEARSVVRLSVAPVTTDEDVAVAAAALARIVKLLGAAE